MRRKTKNRIIDILAAIAVGLMLAWFAAQGI